MAKPPGLMKFMEEVERYCYTTSIVTFLNNESIEFVIDLKRKALSNRIKYGYVSGSRLLLYANLLQGGVVILRSFTQEFDESSQLPVKEIRGYLVTVADNDIMYNRLLPDDLFWSSNTDPASGERLPLEPAVRYC